MLPIDRPGISVGLLVHAENQVFLLLSQFCPCRCGFQRRQYTLELRLRGERSVDIWCCFPILEGEYRPCFVENSLRQWRQRGTRLRTAEGLIHSMGERTKSPKYRELVLYQFSILSLWRTWLRQIREEHSKDLVPCSFWVFCSPFRLDRFIS